MANPLLLVPLLALATAAPAPDPQTLADARCVVAMGSVIDTPDPKAKQLAVMTLLYFMGRIDGRSPGLDIKTVYDGEAKKMSPQEVKPMVQSCIEQVQQRLARG